MNSKFIQIAADSDGLVALDDEGRVWSLMYRPAERRSVWILVTAERDPKEQKGTP
jgi:hypothetical protein